MTLRRGPALDLLTARQLLDGGRCGDHFTDLLAELTDDEKDEVIADLATELMNKSRQVIDEGTVAAEEYANELEDLG